MRWLKTRFMVAGWLLTGLSLIVCSPGGSGTQGAVDKDEWRLVFTRDGAEVELMLEYMHVYLVEEYDEYPEVFEIAGEGVSLVGTFPMACHVGYEDDWAVLLGKSIEVAPVGGARDDKMSYVQMPDGNKAFVVSGTLVPEELKGKIDGVDGDRTLRGTFMLRIRTGQGEEEIAGRFAVHCLTLG